MIGCLHCDLANLARVHGIVNGSCDVPVADAGATLG